VTPIADTVGAMADLVREGKVRYLGVSNVTPREVEEAVSAAQAEGVPLVSVQNEYSLHRRDAEDHLLPLCERLGLGVLPYFPLASGFLTGKYRRGQAAPPGSRLEGRPERLTDDAFDRLEALERYAEARGLALLEVAIGGLAAQTAVTSVIAGATAPGQVRANVRAAAWEPTEEDLRELAALR
jgi:aryl-alcohol dehydrogenase-like predicted oxidoreductase